MIPKKNKVTEKYVFAYVFRADLKYQNTKVLLSDRAFVFNRYPSNKINFCVYLK